MADIQPWPFDILTRVIKIVREGDVYVIISAEGAYAIPNPDRGVTVIETKSEPDLIGTTGNPITATLLESPSSAGEDFATLEAVGGGGRDPDGEPYAERVDYFVAPKTEEVKANWFDMYVRDGLSPAAPFLWRPTTLIISDPVRIRFKIRYEPHLVGGEDGEGTAPMVQLYPLSGAGYYQHGWQVFQYRIDKEGTGQKFKQPPAWSTDVIDNIGGRGLAFGKDPPLIAADIPF